MTYTVTQEARYAAMDGYHSFFEDTPNEGWEKAMLAGKHDDDCVVQAFAKFEAETLERAAEVAEAEKWGDRHVAAADRDGNTDPVTYNEACNDIAAAIRASKGKSDE